MNIKMKSTENGMNDGEVQTRTFEKGETYDVGPELGKAFVNASLAVEVKPKTSTKAVIAGKKDVGNAPENKGLKGSPENK